MSLKEIENLKQERSNMLDYYNNEIKNIDSLSDIFFKRYPTEKKYDAEIKTYGKDGILIQLEYVKIIIISQKGKLDYDFNEVTTNYKGFEGVRENIVKKQYMIYIAEFITKEVFNFLLMENKKIIKKVGEIQDIQSRELCIFDSKIEKKVEELIYKVMTKKRDIEKELNEIFNSKKGKEKACFYMAGKHVFFKEHILNIEKRNGRKVYLIDKKQDTKRRIVKILRDTIFIGNNEITQLESLKFHNEITTMSSGYGKTEIYYKKMYAEDVLRHFKTSLKIEDF